MKTLRQKAADGEIAVDVKAAAAAAGVSGEWLAREIAAGRTVLPQNKKNQLDKHSPIGACLRTKVNANLGTSPGSSDIEVELTKLKTAVEAGVDCVMDLSIGGDIKSVRRRIIAESPVPVGTVPIYQAALAAQDKSGSLVEMSADDIFAVIEEQARDGVDFITVHCGVTRKSLSSLSKSSRIMDVVSRGGSFLIAWMLKNDKENPLYEQFDRLLELAARYELTLSLGDGMRPGCLADASDTAQFTELLILGELVQAADKAGVQVMVEGPGHMPIDQIAANIKLEKEICRRAPFYVLGPLVTDIAPGYDHITAAVGGAIAAAAGADFLCYVTPREHLGLPTPEDVHLGVMAGRIAAHAADIAKGIPGAREWDLKMARARKSLNWPKQQQLALDPQRARSYYREADVKEAKSCTMCSEFCAMELISEYLGIKETPVC